MNFREKLYNILNTINTFQDKQLLFENCVDNKLNVSLERYHNNIEIAYDYLLSRDALKVMKTISKEL